jgi:BMFP domain-containing protein YqiC
MAQHFESMATATSSQALQGVETMATWCDDSRCWVYARLDLVRREAVQRQITAHRQQRLDELLKRLTDPRSAAATALAAGAEAVALTDGDADIVALWRQRLGDITLNVIEQDEASAIEIVALDAGAPAPGLPVRFDLHSAEGDIEPFGWTDTEGVAHAAFDGLQGLTTATACIDYGTQQHDRSMLPRRCVTVQVEQVRRRTHLQVSVTPTAALGLREAIAAQFAAHGLDVVAATDTAALSIDVQLHLSPATETGGICFALVEVAVTVTEADTPIHATTASRIRGAGLTREAAIRAALRKPGARLREATLHGRRVRVRVAPRRQAHFGGSSS